MTIWSVEIKEIETLYRSVSGQLPELSKELIEINMAWVTLPEYVKKTILTLINVSKE